MSSLEQTRLVSACPVNPEAYEAYLKGRYEWNKWTEEGVRKSVEYFEQAVQKDPAYAQAWAGMSDAYSYLGILDILPPQVVQVAWQRVKMAALRALELDHMLSEAHVSHADVILYHEWSWSAAEKEFQRAIALDPNYALAHQRYGYFLVAVGRFDEAIAEIKRALDLDPLSPNKRNSLSAALYWAGRYDEALQQFRAVPDPDIASERRHFRMARIYERKGMQKEAVAELLATLRLGGKNQLAALVEQECLSLGYPEAKKTFLWVEIREAQRGAKDGYPHAYMIAIYYALLGEKNKAFEWLDEAFRMHHAPLTYVKVDEPFEALRSDPRFQDLLRRMGLPP